MNVASIHIFGETRRGTSEVIGASLGWLTPTQARKLAYDLLEAADAAAMAEATGFPLTDNRRISSLSPYFTKPV